MVRFSIVILVVIIFPLFMEGQKIVGLRKGIDTLYLDEIHPEDCSSRLLSKFYFPEDSLGACSTFFYGKLSFEIDDHFLYLYIGCSWKLFQLDFGSGKTVKEIDFFDKYETYELHFYNNKLLFLGDEVLILNPQTLNIDSLFRAWPPYAPESLSTEYCEIFVSGLGGADEVYTMENIYDYTHLKPWLNLWEVIDSIFFTVTRNNFIDHSQDCYFFDLLLYNRVEGLHRIDVLTKEGQKLCDLPYQYIDMKYIGQPDRVHCTPLIDLDVDGCEWANHIDRSDTMQCFDPPGHLLVNEARILSPEDLDSIVIALASPDDIEIIYHADSYEGISMTQKGNDLYIYNDHQNVHYLAWVLQQISNSAPLVDFSGKDFTFSFTRHLDGQGGHVSYLDLHYVEQVRKPDSYTLSIPSGEEYQTSLYAGTNDVVSWSPAYYLSCSQCPDPVILPWGDLKYILEVTSPNGCMTIDTLQVEAISRYAKIYIPNIINPTSSVAENRIFSIKGEDIAYYNLQVAHRSGKLIYDEQRLLTGSGQGWDGTYAGELVPEGVYVFAITAYPDHNKQGVISKVSTVTVVR